MHSTKMVLLRESTYTEDAHTFAVDKTSHTIQFFVFYDEETGKYKACGLDNEPLPDGLYTIDWDTYNSNKYLVQDGEIVTGFHEVNGKLYYFRTSDGFHMNGYGAAESRGLRTINGDFYQVLKDNSINRGITQEGNEYYFSHYDGKFAFLVYADDDEMTTFVYESVHLPDGIFSLRVSPDRVKYYLVSDGHLVDGWNRQSDGDKYYRADSDFEHGKAQMAENCVVKFDKDYKVFDENGEIVENGIYESYDTVFFMDYDGEYKFHIRKDDPEYFVHVYDSYAYEGEITVYPYEQDSWYYLVHNERLVTGWVDNDGTMEYYRTDRSLPEGYGRWASFDIVKTDKGTFYFKANGTIATENVQIGYDDNYILYLVDPETHECYGRIYQPLKGDFVYSPVKEDGTLDKNYTGFCNYQGNTYYMKNGQMAKGWVTHNGNKFFFRDSGTMVHGWQYIDGYWRFFRNSGSMVTSRWEWLGKKWKFFNYKGESIDQFWVENGKTWLSQPGPNTDYAKGWKTVEGRTYYFRTTSGTRVSGWQYIDGGWKYFRPQGTQAFGWQYIGGNWYFLRNGSGNRVTGRQYIDGRWYNFRNNGTLIGKK